MTILTVRWFTENFEINGISHKKLPMEFTDSFSSSVNISGQFIQTEKGPHIDLGLIYTGLKKEQYFTIVQQVKEQFLKAQIEVIPVRPTKFSITLQDLEFTCLNKEQLLSIQELVKRKLIKNNDEMCIRAERMRFHYLIPCQNNTLTCTELLYAEKYELPTKESENLRKDL